MSRRLSLFRSIVLCGALAAGLSCCKNETDVATDEAVDTMADSVADPDSLKEKVDSSTTDDVGPSSLISPSAGRELDSNN